MKIKLKNKKRIILHQVNCQGVMGAGFAKQIKNKYPLCFTEYKKICKTKKSEELLGTIYIYEGDKDIIINMFSQDKYGRDKRYTDYIAMEKAIKKLRKIYPSEIIIAPYKIGCGLAGGNWDIVKEILERYNIIVSKNIIFI